MAGLLLAALQFFFAPTVLHGQAVGSIEQTDTESTSSIDLDTIFTSDLSAEQRLGLDPKAPLEEAVALMNPEQRSAARQRLAAAELNAQSPADKKAIAKGYLILDERSPNAGEGALRIAADIQTQQPNDPDGYTLAAGGLYQRGDYSLAAEQAKEALRRDPSDRAAFAILKLSEDRIDSVNLKDMPNVARIAEGPTGSGNSGNSDNTNLPYKLPVKVGPTKAPPPIVSSPGDPQSKNGGVPPAVPIGTGGLLLTAGAFLWSKWGKDKVEEKKEELWQTAKVAAAGGLIVLGTGAVIYGGAAIAGAITVTPGMVAAGAGGGALTTGGTIAVNVAAAAKGVVATVTGGKLLYEGASLMSNPGGGGGGGGGRHKYSGKTVSEILIGKRGNIKSAPLEKGSPSWEQIKNMKWEEIVQAARERRTGYDTIKKLLTDSRFDKP